MEEGGEAARETEREREREGGGTEGDFDIGAEISV